MRVEQTEAKNRAYQAGARYIVWNVLRHYERWCTHDSIICSLRYRKWKRKKLFLLAVSILYSMLLFTLNEWDRVFFSSWSSIFMVFYCCCLVFCCCCWCNCICLVIIAIQQGWDGKPRMCVCVCMYRFFSARLICFSSRHWVVSFVCYAEAFHLILY